MGEILQLQGCWSVAFRANVAGGAALECALSPPTAFVPNASAHSRTCQGAKSLLACLAIPWLLRSDSRLFCGRRVGSGSRTERQGRQRFSHVACFRIVCEHKYVAWICSGA